MYREFCEHKTLHFHSGDYYVECDDCHAKWVACDPWDIRAPDQANRGVGCGLSGHKRFSPDRGAYHD